MYLHPFLWGCSQWQQYYKCVAADWVSVFFTSIILCSGNPYCDDSPSANDRLGCTLDRGAVAQCNVGTYTADLDSDFQVAYMYVSGT